MDEKEKLYHVVFRGTEHLSQHDKDLVGKKIDSIFEKFSRHLGEEPHFHLDVHPHKEQTREVKRYYCKVTLTSDLGRFHADDGHTGVALACNHVLDKVASQVQKRLAKVA